MTDELRDQIAEKVGDQLILDWFGPTAASTHLANKMRTGLADSVMAVVGPLVTERDDATAENALLRAEVERAQEALAAAARVAAERNRLRESRLRWAEEAAQVTSERAALWALCKTVVRMRRAERCKGCHEDGKELAALRASDVVLPPTWQHDIRHELYHADADDNVIGLIESWRPAAAEPAETPSVKLMREGIERSRVDAIGMLFPDLADEGVEVTTQPVRDIPEFRPEALEPDEWMARARAGTLALHCSCGTSMTIAEWKAHECAPTPTLAETRTGASGARPAEANSSSETRCTGCTDKHTYTGDCRWEIASFAEVEISDEH